MQTLRHSPGLPHVAGFFDPRTFSVQYVVSDPSTKRCAIIDPVLDFDEKSGAIATHHADELLGYVTEQGFSLEWILYCFNILMFISALTWRQTFLFAPDAC
ncbi:hypothetical protein [uncultured Kushneria sp.]|uniref:hypothetical protein n=1 Tax=uncultured Kushneria sp. TaxID=905033 RepID=UPI00261BF46B|nr:hypothetical protein [uncultured Kushneria sp.]